MKTVLYLIQAKAELPAIYKVLRKRNFLLLSYKTKTSDTTIFAPNTTWTEGRNLLYEYVKKHNLIYDYYVLMDEDIILFPTSLKMSKYAFLLLFICKSKILPLSVICKIQEEGYQSLEATLELNYPIITIFMHNLPSKKIPINKYYTQPLENFRTNPVKKNKWHLQQVADFDAILNAISKEAFFSKTVLPYTTIYDNQSWYTSQYIFYIKANYHYYNQILQNNCYRSLNNSHTNYPRKGFTKELQKKIYRDLCREYNVDEIKASEYKEVQIKNVPYNLKGRYYNNIAIRVILDLILIVISPIAIVLKIIEKINRKFTFKE